VRVSVAEVEVKPLSGGESKVEIGTEADDAEDTDEPDLLFAGDPDREPYPVFE